MEGTRFLYPEEMNRAGDVRAVFTTRRGGVSTGPWRGLNLGLHVGDQIENVRANREMAARELGVPLDHWVCGEQVHGQRVTVVRDEHRGRGARVYEDALPATDALVTDRPGIVLSAFAADCVPILLYDPDHKAIAAVHAGWKGTMSRIAEAAVRTMRESFGTDPARLMAAIGPAIDACCYEVDQRVYGPFVAAYSQGEKFFRPNSNRRWQLALPEANRQILLESGLQPARVARVGGCTACDTGTFFSHRAENGKTGRHAGLIVLL